MPFVYDNPGLTVGDFVFSRYHKGQLLFKITDVERRFLTQDDLFYNIYEGNNVGDEYSSLATVESIADFSITKIKKFRKTVQVLDVSYLEKVTPEELKKRIKALNNLVKGLL